MSEDFDTQRIRRASAAFAKGEQPIESRRHRVAGDPAAIEAETPEVRRERISALAKAREARKRQKRAGLCMNGHELTPENITPTGSGLFNCAICLRAKRVRANERRRVKKWKHDAAPPGL